MGTLSFCLVVAATVIVWSSKIDDRPAAPAELTYQALSATSVKLSWTGPTDVDKYVVRVGTDRALTAEVQSIESTAPNTTLRGLATSSPGVDHFFRIDAYRGDQVSSSRTGTFNLAPAAIKAPKVAKVAPTGVKLQWPASTNARQYDIVIARDEDFTEHVRAVRTIGNAPSYTTEALSPGKKYFVKARPVNGSTLGAFSVPAAFTTPPDTKTFIVGSWNVCSEKCKNYTTRARIGAAYFNTEDIDIFGLQESGGVRVGRTTEAIWSGGSQGYVRATGGAKARYIFYRPALFSQVDGGYFSVGDGRHATWAQLLVKGSKQGFFYVNVHLEDGHGNDAKRARETKVILAQMAQINAQHLPIIYAGDFNSGKHRPKDSPATMLRAAGMVDAFDVTSSDPVNARFNSGHSLSTRVPASGALIDHIFVSPQFRVSSWEQLVRISDGRYREPMVSDHNALKSTVTLGVLGVSSVFSDNGLGDPTPATEIPGDALTLR